MEAEPSCVEIPPHRLYSTVTVVTVYEGPSEFDGNDVLRRSLCEMFQKDGHFHMVKQYITFFQAKGKYLFLKNWKMKAARAVLKAQPLSLEEDVKGSNMNSLPISRGM